MRPSLQASWGILARGRNFLKLGLEKTRKGCENGRGRGSEMRAIDLELTNAEVEVRQLEARLRVVPMNDVQLAQALRRALTAKRERLERLRARHSDA